MEIGNKIKSLRLHRSVAQEALAEAQGVTAQAVSKRERDAGTPDIALLRPFILNAPLRRAHGGIIAFDG